MEEFITLKDNTKVWTHSSGAGTPAVMLNGGPGMADYLGPVAESLTDQLRIHRYEQRGCGRTASAGPFTLATFVSDIEELRIHWGHEKWYVIGHSWGVDLALAYALHHPAAVQGLIGLAGGRIHNDRDWKQAYDNNRHHEAQAPAAAPPNLTVNRLLNKDWRAFCKQPELLKQLAMLDTSAAFLYGEDDIRPAWPTQQIVELLPNAQFHSIAKADHNLWQAQPIVLRELIIRYLEDDSPS